MNPWALLVILLGVMLVVIGVKGTQHDIASAITGKTTGSGTPANASGTSGTVGGGKTQNMQKNQNPVQTGTPLCRKLRSSCG